MIQTCSLLSRSLAPFLYEQGTPAGLQFPALKDVPQLQDSVAFGLENLKPTFQQAVDVINYHAFQQGGALWLSM